jgi:serine/threonine protein kinase
MYSNSKSKTSDMKSGSSQESKRSKYNSSRNEILSDAPTLTIAQFRSQYTWTKELGAGAEGAVFAGVHVKTQEPVAIKFIAYSEDNEASQVLWEEFQMSLRVNSPNVVKYRDVLQLSEFLEFELDENESRDPSALTEFMCSLVLVMDFIKGVPLNTYVDMNLVNAPLKTRMEAAEMFFEDIKAGLSKLHANCISHRDLKPANVMLRAGSAVIVDLGVACCIANKSCSTCEKSLRKCGHLEAGTAAYWSPQKYAAMKDKTLHWDDKADDKWALGLILFYMITCDPQSIPIWLRGVDKDLLPEGHVFAEIPESTPPHLVNALKNLLPVPNQDVNVSQRVSTHSKTSSVVSGASKMSKDKNSLLDDESSDIPPTLTISQFKSQYTWTKELGAGSEGAVFSGVHVKTQEAVAIKFIAYTGDDEAPQMLWEEFQMSLSVNSPNVVKYREAVQLSEYLEIELDDDENRNPDALREFICALVLVMDFVKGVPLDTYVSSELVNVPLMTRMRAAEMFYKDIEAGVNEIHANCIAHRDLKPANIMLQSGKAVIVDLGVACRITNKYCSIWDKSLRKCGRFETGTAAYWSPQKYAAMKDKTLRWDDKDDDKWALGLILFYMITCDSRSIPVWLQGIDEDLLPEGHIFAEMPVSTPKHLVEILKDLLQVP